MARLLNQTDPKGTYILGFGIRKQARILTSLGIELPEEISWERLADIVEEAFRERITINIRSALITLLFYKAWAQGKQVFNPEFFGYNYTPETHRKLEMADRAMQNLLNYMEFNIKQLGYHTDYIDSQIEHILMLLMPIWPSEN